MKIVVVKVLRKISNERKIFLGTAFFINKITLVTARHVIDYAESDDIYLRELPDGGDLLILKDSITICEERDVAFFKTKREFDVSVELSPEQVKIGSEVEIKGYYDLTEGVKSYKHYVSAILNAQYTYEIQGHLTEGLSGSPVFIDNKIVGIAQAISQGKNITYFIPISECCCPDELENKDLNKIDNEKININLLKQILNDIFFNKLEEVQKSAYAILPKVYTLPLSNSIAKIIDEVNEMEDDSNPNNIPILCFTKKLYELNQDNRLLEWRKNTAKNIFNIELHECACIENTLDGSHNIIIDIDPKNRNLSDSDVVVWEDKDYREDKVDYRIVQTYKNLDLEDDVTVQKFVDDLKLYLQKFTNPRGILLEFVLPIKFLDLDIKLWADSDNVRLPQKYPIVFRFRERFVNFKKFEKEWLFHWNTTYLNNKSKTLNENAEYLEDSLDIDAYTAEDSACVITTTPISILKGKPIFDNGISIMISSQNCKNSEEIEHFNDWLKDEFETTVIEKSIRAVNKIFARKHESFESNMILIWDNPNNMPKNSQYSMDN